MDTTYGEGWGRECAKLGLDPLTATADDILGAPIDRMRAGNSWVVLLPQDDDFKDIEPVFDYLTSNIELSNFIQSVVEVAGLTQAEAEVVSCIADGVPVTYNYANAIAERLGIDPIAVRMRWMRAKLKLISSWAVEPELKLKENLSSSSEGSCRY